MPAPTAKTKQPKALAGRSASPQRSPRVSISAKLADNRPVAATQRAQQAMITASPRQQQAAQLQAQIAQSPRQRAAQLRATGGPATAIPTQLAAAPAPVQTKENKTGLPDKLKAGVEHLSGYSLNDVQVHYNSAKPAQLQAHAYAQGADIHVAPGQEKHLPHEAWHVVQQKQGRVQPTTQLKDKVRVNSAPGLETEADVMGSKSMQAVSSLSVTGPQRQLAESKVPAQRKIAAARPVAAVVQRYVGSYKDGTLAVTTRAMRGLTEKQMEVVQDLHDDEDNDYTIEEARTIATSGTSAAANPYDWDVTGIGNYATPDKGVQDVLNSFGHPTQSVVKTYDDLASRVGFDVGKNRKGALTPTTVSDLHQQFDATAPLHIGMNPFLNSAWQGNLDNYSGAKQGIPLYSVMRSGITKDFKSELLGNASLNEVLKQVSGRPSEVHHLLFKALHPNRAADTGNLMLTERSERESEFGPGQHELMHMVASGNHSDKFRELLPQYTAEYKNWMKANSLS